MKYNKIILPALAATMLLTGCDDTKMEWGTPEGHNPVTSADIPIAVKEVLANYGDIKDYAAQYTPQMTVGLGLGATKYVTDSTYNSIANANFQMFTTGNAMKMDAMVKSNGSLDFTSLDEFLDAMPSDKKLYGHNFIWHTQQQQTHLKSLIAPTWVPASTSTDDVCENIVANSGFENQSTAGYTGLWGKYNYEIVSPGQNSDYCLKFTMSDETSVNYDSQLFYVVDPLVEGVTYAYSFWVKSDCNLTVQFMGQNASYAGIYKDSFTAASDWVYCTGEFTYDGSNADITKVGIQFGGTPGSTLWIDNFKFGKKIEDPMENVVTNVGFEDQNTTGYTGLWGKYNYEIVSPGQNSDYCIKFTMTDETSVNYDSQIFYVVDPLIEGTTYAYSFYVKSDCSLTVQFMGQNASYAGIYKDSFTAPSDWYKCEGEFTYDGSNADITKVGIQFGGTPGSTLWFDNFKFGVKKDDGTSTASVKSRAATRAASGSYTLMSAEEKREALLGFMDTWIKGMADHLAEKGITPYAYDVVNEPINDADNQPRGVYGTFGGSVTDDDGNTTYDSEPTETEDEGLTLNWGSGHFYWGYYVKDYAVQAFQKARQYLPSETKLFVNDYNLETSPNKLAALIQFANDIDEANGSTIVDGIGTQMHLSISATDDEDSNAELIAEMKAKVDAMFQTMAATGKLVRVTELDVALGTSSPSTAAYKAQSDIYQMVFESYKANVPSDQQSGITIWTLSDAADEHTYWLSGDVPNLWDASYLRKWAYKGVCDGIAGEDIGLQYGGDDYKAYYENNNVSTSVSE